MIIIKLNKYINFWFSIGYLLYGRIESAPFTLDVDILDTEADTERLDVVDVENDVVEYILEKDIVLDSDEVVDSDNWVEDSVSSWAVDISDNVEYDTDASFSFWIVTTPPPSVKEYELPCGIQVSIAEDELYNVLKLDPEHVVGISE